MKLKKELEYGVMKQGVLGDFVQFVYGKGLPASNRKPGFVPVYGSAGMIDTHNTALVKGPGVVVGRKGTVGAVHWSNQDFYPIDTTYYVLPKCKNIRIRYVYYLLKTLPLPQMNTDAAVPGLNRTNAMQLKVAIASPLIQDRIIEILSSYDNLIENNHRRIALLEQSARLLYNEWFVHLRFPGHEHTKIKDGIPEEWERKSLGDIALLKYGKSLKKGDRVPGNYPVYGSSGIIGTHEKALVSGPGIIIGRKGNVGSLFWSASDFYPIDTVYYISNKQCTVYLYYALQHTQFINTDVAVPGLNRDLAHSRELLLPDAGTLMLFKKYTIPIRGQIDRLQRYNNALANVRDLLLPRLINGKVVA